MDNTPDYLNSLETVAKAHGGTSSLAFLGTQIIDQWARFETLARGESYDLFVHLHHDWAGVVRSMQMLCELLYRVPGASWEVDVTTIRAKDAEYGGSWHRRGGQGAFFMLARKWDRIEKQLATYGDLGVALSTDKRQEGIIDDINDLRCYLLLVLSWHEAKRNPVPIAVPIEDGSSVTEPIAEDHPF